MCVGIPLRIVEAEGIRGLADTGELVDLSLTGPLPHGTWVLTFLGAAREVLDPVEALKIRDALAGLERLMTGGTLGDAFADLDRAPQLPPHLAAAAAAGKTTA